MRKTNTVARLTMTVSYSALPAIYLWLLSVIEAMWYACRPMMNKCVAITSTVDECRWS